MNRVVHFEIQVDDMDRAAEFYKAVFGWRFEMWESEGMEYMMVMSGEMDSEEPGINGGMIKRMADVPKPNVGANAFVCTVQIEDYADIEKKVLEAGGKVAIPKMAIPGMAWQGYYYDTEGNVFGVHQPDENAK